jgi:hypothetical protein
MKQGARITADSPAERGITDAPYRCEEPLKTDARGIVELPRGRGAWFKDPDGNLHGLFER